MAANTQSQVLFKEGSLHKRQRGLHKTNTKGLKFQERFFRLTGSSLDYFDPNPKKRATEGPKGQFAVTNMKILQEVAGKLFGKEMANFFFFQVGDMNEVMYFAVKTDQERKEWMEAFEKAIASSGITQLSHYHTGLYGVDHKGRWSCCASSQRTTSGCTPIAKASRTKLNRKELSQTVSAMDAPTMEKRTLAKRHSGSMEDLVSQSEGAFKHSFISQLDSPSPRIRSFTLVDPKRKSKRQTMDFDVEEADLGSVLEKGKRTGADSPAPSVDSGTGSTSNSRPQSQVLLDQGGATSELINHTTTAVTMAATVGSSQLARQRLDSLGKKSTQSTHSSQSDQGVTDLGGPLSPQVPTTTTTTAATCTTTANSSYSFKPRICSSVLEASGEDFQSSTTTTNSGSVTSETSTAKIVTSLSISEETTSSSTATSRETVHSPIRIPNAAIHGRYSDVSALSSLSSLSVMKSPGRKFSDITPATPTHANKLRPRSMVLSTPMSSVTEVERDYSGLHAACRDGNLEEVEEALGLDPRAADLISAALYTPIVIAFLNDHYQVLVHLLRNGAHPNTHIESLNQSCLLHLASKRGYTEVVTLLLDEFQAEVDIQDGGSNTPLHLAAGGGHTAVVETLLNHNACMEAENTEGRVALHECAENGHLDAMELLLNKGAKPYLRDLHDCTPYDLAFRQGKTLITSTLQKAMPKAIRPYRLLHSHKLVSDQVVTSLIFHGNETLISGSRDCNVVFWELSDFTQSNSIKVLDTVLSLAMWGDYLAVGFTSTQLINVSRLDWRRTVADDMNEDESLTDPPLHVVSFRKEDGLLATAGVESNVVKIWPPVSPQSAMITIPQKTIPITQEGETGYVYSLSFSPSLKPPLLAVAVQPGTLQEPVGNKLVYIVNVDTQEVLDIMDGGDGGLLVSIHIDFSPDGQSIAVGCGENLCLWEVESETLLSHFTQTKGTHITSLSYSPTGAHLSAGLSTGEVFVYEIASSSLLFALTKPELASPVTSLVYSSDGGLLATGHQNGMLQLWEGYLQTQPSNS